MKRTSGSQFSFWPGMRRLLLFLTLALLLLSAPARGKALQVTDTPQPTLTPRPTLTGTPPQNVDITLTFTPSPTVEEPPLTWTDTPTATTHPTATPPVIQGEQPTPSLGPPVLLPETGVNTGLDLLPWVGLVLLMTVTGFYLLAVRGRQKQS